jgi:predicted ATP-dependent serine protease
MIGNTSEKEKKAGEARKKQVGQAEIGDLGYGITPAHEAIFEPKEAIKLEKLFDHESLKNATKKRILIQGSAGIGKSTLCHHIAFRWANDAL